MSLSVVTISGGWLLRVACAGGGQAFGLALVPAARGAAEVSGVKAGPQGRRRRRCGAALRPEGRPRMLRGTRRGMSGGVSRHGDWSGRGGQDLVQRLGGGLPAQGLAGPGVQLGGYLL